MMPVPGGFMTGHVLQKGLTKKFKIAVDKQPQSKEGHFMSSLDKQGLITLDHALMGKRISTSFFGFIWNTIRHCTSGTGSKCREETAIRL